MDENMVATKDDLAVKPFSFDFGSEFISQNLPVAKREEIAAVAIGRKMDLAQDVAERTIRLQASNADMDVTLSRADELSKQRGNFVIRSTHDTASGKTTITVSSHSFMLYVVIAIAGLILLLKIL